MPYGILGKKALFWEAFSGKRFICCALIVLCSAVGQSIASLYIFFPPQRHIYLSASRLSIHDASGLIEAIDLPTILYITIDYLTYGCVG